MASVLEPPQLTSEISATPPPPPRKPASIDGFPQVNPWIVAISVMLATFMEVLDTSIASVALPNIAGSMGASNSEATWVLTTYLIANAVVLPASNWFGLRFGRKRFLLTCVVLFIVSSFMCGAAPSLAFLLIARVLQGIGGGALQPTAQAILLESFPPKKRGAAMAVYGFGVVVAPVLGPTLGGWLTDAYSWRYAFYINIPVGLLAIFMISRFVHDPHYIKNAKAGPFDNLGFGLLCLWTGCLQIILDKGQEVDWFSSTWVRWAAVTLAVSFVWFVVHSWRARAPLVDLHIITRNWNFGIGCILIFLLGFVLYIQVAMVPLFYQELLGYTALTAGIIVAPRGLGSMCGLPMVGLLSQRFDNRWLLFIGFVIFSLSSLALSSLNLGIGPYTLLIPIVATGFGMSFLFVPIGNMCTSTVSNEEMGNATGIFNLLRNIGGSVGIAIASTELVRRTTFHQARLVDSLHPSDPALQQHLHSFTGYFGMHFGWANGKPLALASIYSLVMQQALLISFTEIFLGCAIVAGFAAIVGWLFRKVTFHHVDPEKSMH
ncbi:DHA2 family efflux MFS transporter permease subunit [Occallatibacter riparius]|uniref:DHA2 family efflux MFS transporter permease subunit n=1 Tax=Occallatibacter riparius TaxID=1002689 RepID=A0A9J7BUY8_9BACT|nr:DHA2 family efflux MFS transporter permease subunit [Occallatibacter riparius]UWZ86692.1 DHA2 family efflux MFS transporter permease subunit [Occallatibacter riparius]